MSPISEIISSRVRGSSSSVMTFQSPPEPGSSSEGSTGGAEGVVEGELAMVELVELVELVDVGAPWSPWGAARERVLSERMEKTTVENLMVEIWRW